MTELYYFFDPRDSKTRDVEAHVLAAAASAGLPVHLHNARDATAGKLVLAFGLLRLPAVAVVVDQHYTATIDGTELSQPARLMRQLRRLSS